MIIINTYSTAQIAKLANVHPNTIRFYEEVRFLPLIPRKANGYRVFTDNHLEQLKLIRIALRCEIVQGGLRKIAIKILQTASSGDFERVLSETYVYKTLIIKQKNDAKEAIELTEKLLYQKESEKSEPITLQLKRKDTAEFLGISIDVLRDWERNGLIDVPRKINGYRIYTEKEISLLKIIRTLRCASYSMMSIRRMLNHFHMGTDKELSHIINTPDPSEYIVYVTDKFITSLTEAEKDVDEMILQLLKMSK